MGYFVSRPSPPFNTMALIFIFSPRTVRSKAGRDEFAHPDPSRVGLGRNQEPSCILRLQSPELMQRKCQFLPPACVCVCVHACVCLCVWEREFWRIWHHILTSFVLIPCGLPEPACMTISYVWTYEMFRKFVSWLLNTENLMKIK